MKLRRSVSAAVLTAAALLLGSVQAPLAASEVVPGELALAEQDCAETTFPRATDLAAVRAAVPERFGLLTLTTPTGATAARVYLYTYTCRSASVGDVPARGLDSPTTVSIVSAVVTSRDGEPLSGFHTYVLWFGTDNALLRAQLHRLGLPARLLTPDSTATLDLGQPGTPSTVRWALNSPDGGYEVRVRAVEPSLPPPGGGTIRFLHDSVLGELEWVVSNDWIVSTGAQLQADLRGFPPMRDLLANPGLAQIPAGVGINDQDLWSPFTYVRGSWTSRLTAD